MCRQITTRQELHDYGSKSVVVIWLYELMLPVVRRQFFWTLRFHAVFRDHFLWNVVNQKRVGNVIDRRKMLPQPSVLLRISIYPDERINRHDNPTCLRLARIYERAGMTTEIFSQVPLVSAPVQV